MHSIAVIHFRLPGCNMVALPIILELATALEVAVIPIMDLVLLKLCTYHLVYRTSSASPLQA
jgi:hypothetical protein